MKELQNYHPSQLLNLLAHETIAYYKLIGDGADIKECIQCNDRIKQIRQELDARRNKEESLLIQRQYIAVPPEYTY